MNLDLDDLNKNTPRFNNHIMTFILKSWKLSFPLVTFENRENDLSTAFKKILIQWR